MSTSDRLGEAMTDAEACMADQPADPNAVELAMKVPALVVAIQNVLAYVDKCDQESWTVWPDDVRGAIATALGESGLLAPAPLTEEWGTQYEDGSGPVWRETWDGKRIRTRKDADAEVSLARIPPQRTMRRWVTDWEAIE